jgi:hypothetical protein
MRGDCRDLSYWRFLRTKLPFGFLHLLNVFFRPASTLQRFNDSILQRPRSDDATPLLSLRYSSLLSQCLRLVSYATGVLPHLRLRAFHRRSLLPSLYYHIAGNSVAAHETHAASDYSRGGGVRRSRLLDLLSLTKRRGENESSLRWGRDPIISCLRCMSCSRCR